MMNRRSALVSLATIAIAPLPRPDRPPGFASSVRRWDRARAAHAGFWARLEADTDRLGTRHPSISRREAIAGPLAGELADSEAALLAQVLLRNPSGGRVGGVTWQGRFFLALPNPDDPSELRLSVVPLASIRALD